MVARTRAFLLHVHGGQGVIWQWGFLLLVWAFLAHCATPPLQGKVLDGVRDATSNFSMPRQAWLPGTDPCGRADCGAGSPRPRLPCNWPGLSCEAWNVVGLNLSGVSPSMPLFHALPDVVSQLPNLTLLDLSNNNIEGTLPNAWKELRQLQLLDLSHNQMQGLLPTAWRDMDSLHSLDLANNWLQGPLPCTWGTYGPPLQLLRLSHNVLSGDLCPQWALIKTLQVVDLGFNRLAGNIPARWANISDLRYLNLQNMCGICGTFNRPSTTRFQLLTDGTNLGTACSLASCRRKCTWFGCGYSVVKSIFFHLGLAVGVGLLLLAMGTTRKLLCENYPCWRRGRNNQGQPAGAAAANEAGAEGGEGGQGAGCNADACSVDGIGRCSIPSVIVVQPDEGRALAYAITPKEAPEEAVEKPKPEQDTEEQQQQQHHYIVPATEG